MSESAAFEHEPEPAEAEIPLAIGTAALAMTDFGWTEEQALDSFTTPATRERVRAGLDMELRRRRKRQG